MKAPDFPLENPYPEYARWREREPVLRTESPSPLFPEQWWLLRHADVEAALRDPRLGRDWHRAVERPGPPRELPAPLRELVALVDSWMLFVDPPLHTELRGAASPAFRPKALAPFTAGIEARARALADATLGRRGSLDVIADFALPLTAGAIADVLGVPASDQPAALRAMIALEPVFGGAGQALVQAAEAARELLQLFGRFVPGEGDARRRAIASAIFIFGAGFATTIHGIANGVLALLRHADQAARLRADASLLPGAVEEILRYHPPIQKVQRFALEPLEIAGHAMARGAIVVPVLAAANRDPAVFPDPDRFDVARDARAQLAFGGGIHHCLGAHLARLEIRIGLAALLPYLSRLRIADEPLEWRETAARGLRRLRLESAG